MNRQLRMNYGILCGLRSASLAILGLIFLGDARAQEHHLQKYYPPTDTLVQQKLATWGDMKFGLLMHWGPYSQWGIGTFIIKNEDTVKIELDERYY